MLSKKKWGLDSCCRFAGRPSPSLFVAIFLLLGISASCGFAQSAAPAAAADSGAWTLGERSVAAPAGASDDLRSAIAASPAPNVAQRQQMPAMSEDQWLAMQQGSSQADLGAMSKQFNVTIERGSYRWITHFGPIGRATTRLNKDRTGDRSSRWEIKDRPVG